MSCSAAPDVPGGGLTISNPRHDIAPALPAASLILIRDADPELELLMLERHQEMRFATGAVVFPGGKVETLDRSEGLRAYCAEGGESDEEVALRVAAIRETFEESGILLARERATGAPLGRRHTEALADARRQLEHGETEFSALLRERDWELACDRLVAYAHWITPEMMPKRFDTHFFLARAPEQVASHDGSESVDSFWIGPRAAMRDAQDGARPIMFPQLRNIEKLCRARDVADALARAAGEDVVTVLPRVVETAEGRVLRIPSAAGYDVNEIPFVPPKPPRGRS